MSPKDRDALWKAAWGELKSWTQMISSLPDKGVVHEFAIRAVRKVAYGNLAARNEVPIIAEEIANWICENFDADKRKRPETSRIERNLRDQAIQRAYLDAQAAGQQATTGSLSRSFGVSRTTVWRALNDVREGSSKGVCTPHDEVADTKRLIEKMLPRDGKRAIFVEVLAKQIGVPSYLVWPRLYAITTKFPGWHFYAHGEEVVMSRGRKLSRDQISNWRDRARSSSVLNPKRLLHDHRRAVWGDLLTIFAVLTGNASSDDWRVFLAIFTVKPLEWQAIKQFWSNQPQLVQQSLMQKLICADPAFMANRVQSAFNAGMDYCQVRSIERYNQQFRRDSDVLGEILYYVELTREFELEAALKTWLHITGYQIRVQLELIPDRNSGDIESFLEVARDYDNDQGHLDDLLARYDIE